MSEMIWFLRSILNNQINKYSYFLSFWLWRKPIGWIWAYGHFSLANSNSSLWLYFAWAMKLNKLLNLLLSIYFILRILRWLAHCIPKFSQPNMDLPIFDNPKSIFTYFYLMYFKINSVSNLNVFKWKVQIVF